MVICYQHKTQNTKTIKDSFKPALINLDESENELLKTKLAKLKVGNILSGNKKLETAKSKENTEINSGLADLKQACQEIYDSGFTNKESKIFLDFQAYCARTIKDKVTKDGWATDGAKWKNRFDKLSKDGTRPVSSELQQIASKTSQDGNALKDWCTKVADLVFEGDENEEFKDAKAFCRKAD